MIWELIGQVVGDAQNYNKTNYKDNALILLDAYKLSFSYLQSLPAVLVCTLQIIEL